LCYSPRKEDIPEIRDRVAGPFVFGSFARVEKITDEVVTVWAQIMAMCPDAVIELKAKAFEDDDVRKKYLGMFSRLGVLADRINILPQADSITGHIDCYNRIDVTLDTFPYNGTTTTCESLMMGVPVVTVSGRAHQSRVGESVLRHAGFSDWVCDNTADYISRACSFYGMHKNGYKECRKTISRCFAGSSVCDSWEFAKGFYTVLNKMAVGVC
jgi:predicted O-linked N-acetylglucosamine transferase (SPINDLY family)